MYIYDDLISASPGWALHLYMHVGVEMYRNECLKLTRILKRGVLPDATILSSSKNRFDNVHT